MEEEANSPSPVLVAIAGLILPGAGYLLVGERKRGLIVGGTLLVMFLAGILLAGIRVIEVPGFGDDGRKIYVEYYLGRDQGREVLVPQQTIEPAISVEPTGKHTPGGALLSTVTRRNADGSVRQQDTPNPPQRPGQWVLMANFGGEIANRIWYVPQALMGLPTAIASYFSIAAAAGGAAKSHARLAEIGTLYTAIAGMLNLLAVIDATSRCDRKEPA